MKIKDLLPIFTAYKAKIQATDELSILLEQSNLQMLEDFCSVHSENELTRKSMESFIFSLVTIPIQSEPGKIAAHELREACLASILEQHVSNDFIHSLFPSDPRRYDQAAILLRICLHMLHLTDLAGLKAIAQDVTTTMQHKGLQSEMIESILRIMNAEVYAWFPTKRNAIFAAIKYPNMAKQIAQVFENPHAKPYLDKLRWDKYQPNGDYQLTHIALELYTGPQPQFPLDLLQIAWPNLYRVLSKNPVMLKQDLIEMFQKCFFTFPDSASELFEAVMYFSEITIPSYIVSLILNRFTEYRVNDKITQVAKIAYICCSKNLKLPEIFSKVVSNSNLTILIQILEKCADADLLTQELINLLCKVALLAGGNTDNLLLPFYKQLEKKTLSKVDLDPLLASLLREALITQIRPKYQARPILQPDISSLDRHHNLIQSFFSVFVILNYPEQTNDETLVLLLNNMKLTPVLAEILQLFDGWLFEWIPSDIFHELLKHSEKTLALLPEVLRFAFKHMWPGAPPKTISRSDNPGIVFWSFTTPAESPYDIFEDEGALATLFGEQPPVDELSILIKDLATLLFQTNEKRKTFYELYKFKYKQHHQSELKHKTEVISTFQPLIPDLAYIIAEYATGPSFFRTAKPEIQEEEQKEPQASNISLRS